MKKHIIILCILISLNYHSFAQTNPPQETPKPLELPNFIIEGVEQVNVKSGIKQLPTRINKLTKEELDSINSYEKHSSLLLAPDTLPTKSISKIFPKINVRSSIGMFFTPEITLGARQKVEGYDLYGYLNYESSSGEYKRSEYNKFSVNLFSDYIAPDKFWIFGGSRTRSSVFFNSKNYNLYANQFSLNNDGYFDRNASSYGINLETNGAYEGVLFNTGFNINSLQLSANSKSISYHPTRNAVDNEIKGFLNIKNYWNDYLINGNILVDFHSLRKNSINFIEVAGGFSYFSDELSIAGNVGLQSATNSNETSRGGLLLEAQIEYRINELFTVKSSFISGLENNSFSEMFYKNPYLDFSANLDYSYNIALINGSITYHPTENIFASANISWRITDRLCFFDEINNNTFNLAYDQGTILEISPELLWYITKSDKIAFNTILSLSKLNNSDGPIPYHPFFKSNISYRKVFFEKLGFDISLSYISENDISNKNDKKLESYLDFSFSTDYIINNNFVFFANFNNLLGSNIYYWNGYKERGLFAKIGIIWQY
ncbi:MAG: hypothetical protein N3A67_07660 [Ignavibacteria bacterium]|nr:hypothetical protein [Ignavibacteria bacterium]